MKCNASILTIALVIICAVTLPNAQAQSRARDGAVVGGATGAVIGGIIGHQNDETPEGALIGGAVGAIAGSLMGDAQDQRIAREQMYRDQIVRQQQIQAQNARRAATVADVIQMTNNGISDSVIINHLQANGIERKLEVHDIISMHQQGVSEDVIAGMQRAPIARYRVEPQPVVAPPPTIIVEEPYPYYRAYPRIYQAYPVGPSFHYHWR